MESLHAPWRIEYILAPKSERPAGLFRDIADSSADTAKLVLMRDRTGFALLNRYPYTGGHVLVVPYRQVADLNGLTDDELADLWKLTRRCVNVLKQVMKPDGFNVGFNIGKAAGAGYAGHLHLHVVPRWEGDTNFMPVLTQDKVISESLESMRQRLADG